MKRNDYTENMPCIYYHPTGVIFKYIQLKTDKCLRLTHAVIPVNCDDLFVIENVHYQGNMYATSWPYHNIKPVSPEDERVLKTVKLYLMDESKKLLLGYFFPDDFLHSRNFIVRKIIGDPVFFGSRNTQFSRYNASKMYQFLDEKAENFKNNELKFDVDLCFSIIYCYRQLLLYSHCNTAKAMKKALIKNCCINEKSERIVRAYINDENYYKHQALDFYNYQGTKPKHDIHNKPIIMEHTPRKTPTFNIFIPKSLPRKEHLLYLENTHIIYETTFDGEEFYQCERFWHLTEQYLKNLTSAMCPHFAGDNIPFTKFDNSLFQYFKWKRFLPTTQDEFDLLMNKPEPENNMTVSNLYEVPFYDYDVYDSFFSYIHPMDNDEITINDEFQNNITFENQGNYEVNVQKDTISHEKMIDNYQIINDAMNYSQNIQHNYNPLEVNEEIKYENKSHDVPLHVIEDNKHKIIEITSDYEVPMIDPTLINKIKCEDKVIPVEFRDLTEEDGIIVDRERLPLDKEDEYNSREKPERARFIIESYFEKDNLVLCVVVQNTSNKNNRKDTLLRQYTTINIPFERKTIENVRENVKIMDEININFDYYKSQINYWYNNTEKKSKKCHNVLEHLPEIIMNDYYSFIDAEITRISSFNGRKIPALKDLILYCSLIPQYSYYSCEELIIRKIFSLPSKNYPKTNKHLNIEDKSSYQEIHKLKQKYSFLFYSYMEAYDKLKYSFNNLMELEHFMGLRQPIELEGTGLGIVHEVCNFTYKCNKSELGLREDFKRLLAYIIELKKSNNVTEISKLWYKFMCRIVRHHLIRNYKVNTQEIDNEFPKFKLIPKTNTYEAWISSEQTLLDSFTCNFDSIRKTTLYKQYLRVTSVINASSKPSFKEGYYKKLCRNEIMKENKEKDDSSMSLDAKEDNEDEYSNENFENNEEYKEDNLVNVSPVIPFVFSEPEESLIRLISPVMSDYKGNYSNYKLKSKSDTKIKKPNQKQKLCGDVRKLVNDITEAKKLAKERHQFSKDKNVSGTVISESNNQSIDDSYMMDMRQESPEGVSSFINKDKNNGEEEKEVRVGDKRLTPSKKVNQKKLNTEKKLSEKEMKPLIPKNKNKEKPKISKRISRKDKEERNSKPHVTSKVSESDKMQQIDDENNCAIKKKLGGSKYSKKIKEDKFSKSNTCSGTKRRSNEIN